MGRPQLHTKRRPSSAVHFVAASFSLPSISCDPASPEFQPHQLLHVPTDSTRSSSPFRIRLRISQAQASREASESTLFPSDLQRSGLIPSVNPHLSTQQRSDFIPAIRPCLLPIRPHPSSSRISFLPSFHVHRASQLPSVIQLPDLRSTRLPDSFLDLSLRPDFSHLRSHPESQHPELVIQPSVAILPRLIPCNRPFPHLKLLPRPQHPAKLPASACIPRRSRSIHVRASRVRDTRHLHVFREIRDSSHSI